jgi:hypothetical protein
MTTKLVGSGCQYCNPEYLDDHIPDAKNMAAQPAQEPVAMLERDPSIGRLRVTYEAAVTELDEGVYPLYTKPQGWRDNVAQAYLKGFDEGERRYRWLRKEYAESRETYLAECIPSENALDEYIDRQMAKTSIKTERWSGK